MRILAPSTVGESLEDSVPDFAFILVDLDGNITDWNAGAENLLWYTSGQMVGHSLNLIFTPEDREIGIPEQKRAKAMALGRAEDERWHVRSDGSHFRASGTLTTLKDAEAAAILGFAKVLRDVTVREQEREQIERTLRERTTLVKEIQHRVKNNLQMIVSLINLQADRISDPGTRTALQETQNRVRAIAAVHESLYATQDFGTISLGPYLHHLLRDLRSLYDSGNRIRVDLVSDDLALDIRDAIPLALISNELLSNSLRDAFPGGRHGVVTIRLRYVAASDRVRLLKKPSCVFPTMVSVYPKELASLKIQTPPALSCCAFWWRSYTARWMFSRVRPVPAFGYHFL